MAKDFVNINKFKLFNALPKRKKKNIRGGTMAIIESNNERML